MPESSEKLRRLLGIATQLTSTLNVDDLLELIMTSAAELLDARAGSLLLLDEETDELVFRVATADPEIVGTRIPAGAGIAGAAVQSREPVVIGDTSQDERFYGEVDKAVGVRTENLVAVPLVVKDRALGVIEVMNKREGTFGDDDVEIARALASLAAVALDNAAMYAKLADAVVAARMSYRL